jgi:peptidoglycan-associated lipoprotein
MLSASRLTSLVALFLAVACAGPAIVVDPENNPAVTASASSAAAAQPVPIPPPPAGPPPLGAPPIAAPVLNLPALQADLAAKAGSNQVRFDLHGFELSEAARATLLRQAQWLRANPFVRVSVEGHADVRLSRDTAIALGERRAAAVLGFLLAQGIPPEQLSPTSWGKERPVAPAVHEAAWLQNSRVELVLVR